jgi:hypothetical protein
MKYSLFEPSLEYINSKLTQREILEHYIGQSIDKTIRSPFREDRKPTITFKEYANGKVLWTDWSTGEMGDAFNWICKLYNISFKEAIRSVYRDLIEGKGYNTIIEKKPFYEPKMRLKKEFIVEVQDFRIKDLAYWNTYGISKDTLFKYNVFSVRKFTIPKEESDIVFNYGFNDPMFGYRFYYNTEEYWKIYRPLSNRRFFYNGTVSIMEGYDQLPLFGDRLIITKSLKDVMLLHELGYDAISLQGESNPITEINYDTITDRFKDIIVFYDNDEPGIKNTTRMVNSYNFKSILVPTGIDCKDISDVYKTYGKEYSISLMQELLHGI